MMTPERWQQVKSTLAGALEISHAEERESYLASTCGEDTDLRREVNSLLEQPPDEFETCAETIGLVHRDPLQTENVGRRIGAYELLRELGRGGMGAVWLAKRADQQFEKLVAIKLLKRGTDTDEVVRRFRSERQILARLEHPNIARILDGGVTDDGLPYFVMEHIVGAPVTDFCFAQNSTVEARLRLFQKICAAVQFAHQNLVIHRDLKPANILIDGEGEPKLLDFGIAKLVDPEEGALEATGYNHQRLTPAYASPEQVRGDPITTVSDVYALGAILYQLLTLQTPHRFARAQPTHTEMMRVVVGSRPIRPSQAARDPQMQQRLRGDLDNIILKALRKEPAQRYGGVIAFSEDIRRHLEQLPIRARRATALYRAGKFYRRNKLAVLAAIIILITLVAGVITTTRQARVARRQRALAERRFNDVRKIANSLMFELHNAIKDLPGALAARQIVSQRALEYLDSLAQESGNDLSLKSELATAYGKIGLVTFDVPQAINSHRKATTLNEELVQAEPKNVLYRKQLSESYNNLSDVLKIAGNSTQSIEYARRSLAVMQALAKENSGDREIQVALADRYLSLGLALIDAGDFKQALQSDLQAMSIQQEVVARDPSDKQAVRDFAGLCGNVANAYEDSGDYATALEYSRKSLNGESELVEVDPTNARSRRSLWAAFFRLGRQLALTGDTAGALQNYTKATQLIEGLSAADPQDRGHRRWLAVTYLSLGELMVKLNQFDKALENYRKATAISEEIFAADPDRAETRRDLARMYEALALWFAKTDQVAPALEYFKKAESMAEAAASHDPQNARVQIRRARIWTEMASFYRTIAEQRGAPVESRKANVRSALELYRRSLGIWQDSQHKGMLSSSDATMPDEVTRAIAECESILK